MSRSPRSGLIHALGVVGGKRRGLPDALVHTTFARADLASRLRFTSCSFAFREIKASTLANVVDQSVDRDVAIWLADDLAAARPEVRPP